MKLGLLGFPIKHSLSPKLYQEILGGKLSKYDLLEYETASSIPSLKLLSQQYDGLNITTPYKEHFVESVSILSPVVREIKAINTMAFTEQGVYATNTDVVAVEEILQNYQQQYPALQVLLLGSGVMARVTCLVCGYLNIPIRQIHRQAFPDMQNLDLIPWRDQLAQNLIINACSRDFVFKGLTHKDDIFWDYNYSFSPHSSSLPQQVKLYQDGQDMLRRQALAAVRFWCQTNPKLKC